LVSFAFCCKIEANASYGDIFVIDESDKDRDYQIRLQPLIDSIAILRKLEITKQRALLDSLNAANKRASELSFNYRFIDYFNDNSQKWPVTSEGAPIGRNSNDNKEMYIKDGKFNLAGINKGYLYNSRRKFSGLDIKKISR